MDPLDAHFARAAEMLASHSPTGLVDSRDGIAVGATGAGGPALNPAWVVAPPESPTETVAWMCDLLGTMGVGFCVQIADPFLPTVGPALDAAGLRLAESMPGMVRKGTGGEPPLPPGLRLERVRDAASLEAFSIACATGFGAPDPRQGIEAFGPGLAEDDRVTMLNGYLDGADEPCATSVGVVAEGITGIYAVTCHEHARRRGIGAAMTLAAAAAGAREGATTSLLQSSAMGLPVYRRIGYETVRTYHRYEPS